MNVEMKISVKKTVTREERPAPAMLVENRFEVEKRDTSRMYLGIGTRLGSKSRSKMPSRRIGRDQEER